MKRRHYFILMFIVSLMITGCGSKKGEEIKEPANLTIEDVLVEDILVEDILVEETIISDEYLEELEYNSQKNSWGN